MKVGQGHIVAEISGSDGAEEVVAQVKLRQSLERLHGIFLDLQQNVVLQVNGAHVGGVGKPREI